MSKRRVLLLILTLVCQFFAGHQTQASANTQPAFLSQSIHNSRQSLAHLNQVQAYLFPSEAAYSVADKIEEEEEITNNSPARKCRLLSGNQFAHPDFSLTSIRLGAAKPGKPFYSYPAALYIRQCTLKI